MISSARKTLMIEIVLRLLNEIDAVLISQSSFTMEIQVFKLTRFHLTAKHITTLHLKRIEIFSTALLIISQS